MIPTVTARVALIQTTYWDGEKLDLVADCIYTLLNQRWRQHDIATRRLRRCIGQIATLEHWREGPNQARGATIRATGNPKPRDREQKGVDAKSESCHNTSARWEVSK